MSKSKAELLLAELEQYILENHKTFFLRFPFKRKVSTGNCWDLGSKSKEKAIIVVNITQKDAAIFIYIDTNKDNKERIGNSVYQQFINNKDIIKKEFCVDFGEKPSRLCLISKMKQEGKPVEWDNENEKILAFEWILKNALLLKDIIDKMIK